jgi:hypothetical protein
MRPDAVTLLRELRPATDPPALDEAALERILATPPSDPGRRRRPRRRLALGAAAIALAGAALLPGGSPDVLARAQQALADGDTILHYRAEIRYRAHGAELQTDEPDEHVDARLEAWQADAGRRERFIYDGSTEFVKDWDARVSEAYNSALDQVIRHTDPDVFAKGAEPHGLDHPSPFGATSVGDMARLLERARAGEDHLILVGQTSVRGIDVYELRIEFTVEAGLLQRRSEATDIIDASRTVYVDRKSFLPVRVVERTMGVAGAITDYVEVERLPRTPENERRLEMSPHPGAKVIVEGPV